MSKSQHAEQTTDSPNYDVQIDADELLETLAERAAEHARKMCKHRRDHREYDLWWEREPGALSQYTLWELEELGALRAYSLTITHLQPEALHSWRCKHRNDDGTVDVRGLMQWLSREADRAHEDSYGPHSETRQADAVEHANTHPSNTAREDYDMRYTVSEGYYPGDTTHEIDLSDIPVELRKSASIQAQVQLAKRGLMVNSVDFEAATLHVVTADWFLERLPGMGAEYR